MTSQLLLLQQTQRQFTQHTSGVQLNAEHSPQIALVTHKHDDDVGISMVPQLLPPPLHILEGHCTRAVPCQQKSAEMYTFNDRSDLEGALAVTLLPQQHDGVTTWLFNSTCPVRHSPFFVMSYTSSAPTAPL